MECDGEDDLLSSQGNTSIIFELTALFLITSTIICLWRKKNAGFPGLLLGFICEYYSAHSWYSPGIMCARTRSECAMEWHKQKVDPRATHGDCGAGDMWDRATTRSRSPTLALCFLSRGTQYIHGVRGINWSKILPSIANRDSHLKAFLA